MHAVSPPLLNPSNSLLDISCACPPLAGIVHLMNLEGETLNFKLEELMLVGVVKFFVLRKGYGFLYHNDQEVYFNESDVARVAIGPNYDKPILEKIHITCWPKPGDVVVFIPEKDHRGRTKASAWAFVEEYVSVLEQLAKLARLRVDNLNITLNEALDQISSQKENAIKKTAEHAQRQARNQYKAPPPPPPPPPTYDKKLGAVINLIHNGATKGERDAARAAYKRLTGEPYYVF